MRVNIRILVFMVMFIAGDSQLLGSSILYQMPLLQISNTSSLAFYSCKFNVKVDCFWKVDGTTISLSLHNYTWMIGNGTNTNDCSIQGRSHQVLKLNQNKYNADVTCTGISYGTIKKVVHLGDFIRLDCSFSERSNCSWKRSRHVISISGRYEYIEQHDGSNVYDCSIRIQKIQRIDLTTWICQVTATDGKGQRNLTNAFYNLQLYNMADPTTIGSTASIDSSINKSSTTSSSDKASSPSTKDTSKSSDASIASPSVYIALGVTGTLATMLAVAVAYQCRRQKLRKNREPPDEPRHNTTSSTVIREDFMKPENPSNTEDPEPTYMNVTQPHLTPSPQPEVPQPEQPISTSTPRPRSNIVDDDIQATEVIYKQVVICRKSTASLTREVPHIHIGDVAYATILQKRLSQDFSRL